MLLDLNFTDYNNWATEMSNDVIYEPKQFASFDKSG